MLSVLTKRVNFARTPALLRPKRGYCVKSVLVGNLPFTLAEDDLRGLFSHFGDIYAVFLPFKTKNINKGYGFVSYIVGERPKVHDPQTNVPTPEELAECTKIIENVAKKMNGMILAGRNIRIEIGQNPKYN